MTIVPTFTFRKICHIQTMFKLHRDLEFHSLYASLILILLSTNEKCHEKIKLKETEN